MKHSFVVSFATAALTLIGAGLVAGSAAPARPSGAMGQEDGRFEGARATARARLRHLVETRDTPGISAAVAVDGRVVWADGAGLANLEHQVPATAATRFGLGSLSKTLTVAGMMTLVDNGLLELDAPIERYLPDFPHRGRGITLRRLAAHQSGLSDAFATANSWTTDHYPTIDSAYQKIKDDALVSEPGTTVAYATGTFTIIAKVMEAVTGRPYQQLMQDNVFDRVGLPSIVPNSRRLVVPNRTGFYVRTESGSFEHGAHFDPSVKLPGAGYLGSARDLALFGAAVLGDGLVSERSRQMMFTPVALRDGTVTDYALGLGVRQHRGRTTLHLPGGGIGISTWLYLYPAEKLALVVLSNVPTGSVGGRTHDIIATAFLDALGASGR